MCVNCFTQVDSIAMNGGAALVLASGAWSRVRDVVYRRPSSWRRGKAWDANAAFLSALGHDPATVLGPRPAGAQQLVDG